MYRTVRLCLLTAAPLLLAVGGVGQHSRVSGGEREILAAVGRVARTAGYEVTERRPAHDAGVVGLENQDAEAYGPYTRAVFRLRSLRPWARSRDTYFRYWLLRETYETEGQAEKRAAEYMTNYTERLATPEMSRHEVSKSTIRVGARRRGTTVYLLTTDGAYTLSDDVKNRERLMDALVKAKGT